MRGYTSVPPKYYQVPLSQYLRVSQIVYLYISLPHWPVTSFIHTSLQAFGHIVGAEKYMLNE